MPLLTQAMEECTAPERVHFQTLCSLLLGEAHLLAGLPEEAYTLAQRVLALARAQRERGHEAYTLRLLGEIAARRDAPEIEQAEVSYLQALALAEALAMRPLQAHCHLGLGSLYLSIGQGQQAHAALTTAIDLYRIMRMTFWLPQAEAALSKIEGG